MIQYEFYLNEIGTPQFNIIGELGGLSELGSCQNLEEIILSIKKVISGELEQYDFGYEVYLIECFKYSSKIINTFDNWKVEVEISTLEILKLMQDWSDFKTQLKK